MRRARRTAPPLFLPAAGLALLAAAASAQTPRPAGALAGLETTLAQLDEVDASEWETLADLLEDVHARTGVPAIAAACVRDGEIVASATVGVVAFGSPERVPGDARFHLGSVTKSFTACVVGKLVEEGKLDWDTRVGAVLGDVEMRDAYRDVTIEQLLQHRGGLPAYTDERPSGHPDRTYGGTPGEQRAAFLADALVQEPVGTPGRSCLYSNAGYALAGYMAERVSGESWEQLVRRVVFEPLGMASSGFGFPDAPLGHAGDGPEFQPVPIDAYPPMEIIAPAGNVNASVADLARYANAQLAGLEGRDGFLRAATLQRLHTVAGGVDAGQYASGWIVSADASGDPVHHHGGTVGASYAEVRLHPSLHCATIVLTTVGPGIGEPLATLVAQALLWRYGPEVPGFVRASGSAPSGVRVVEGGTTAEDDARLWHLVREMSTAINEEDRAGYHGLFASSFDRNDADSMFDFMARNVLPSRGGVYAFHALSRSMEARGSRLPMRAVTFHLENGFPGYFGFGLDEAGKIAEFSLFVKGDLCPAGTDRHCAKIAKTLAELE